MADTAGSILSRDGVSVVWIALGLVILYPLLTILYNLTLHPLAHHPGPLVWRSTRLAYMVSCWTGRLHSDVAALHAKYGTVVRIAPNEVSFSDPAAWEDIYSNRGGSRAFPKSSVWHAPQPGRPVAIINCLDAEKHGWMRRRMEPAFTERAVAGQEEIVGGYVDLMIEKLREESRVEGRGEAVVDVVRWFTFVAIDIVCDLSFGETFRCLEKGELSDWVALVFNSLKAATCVATLRHYTWLTWLLLRLIPASVMRKADEHWKVVEEKVDARLAKETERPDFLALWQKDTGKGEGLDKGQVCANAFIMTIAGSETTATSLIGTVNRLVREPRTLKLLTREVRTRFEREEDITFAALKGLPYLNAVINEGFRMCSPIPVGLPRNTPPEGGRVCGHWIPGHMFVNVHQLALFFDKSRFFDPHTFHPERWLPDAINNPSSPFHNDDRSCVNIFSIGPRACIGKPLAMAELRMTLAKLVWAFDVEEADTAAGKLVWEDQRTFTVVEKRPFEVKLIERRL